MEGSIATVHAVTVNMYIYSLCTIHTCTMYIHTIVSSFGAIMCVWHKIRPLHLLHLGQARESC